MVATTEFRVRDDVSLEWIRENFDRLECSLVLAPPAIGHDLVVVPIRMEGDNTTPVNLGKVYSVRMADRSGRNFRVQSELCPSFSPALGVMVTLAEGIYPYLKEE